MDAEDKEFKETIKNARKKLEKKRGLPLCLARQARTTIIVGMVIIPIRPNQNLRVYWKPVNLQDCVWKNHGNSRSKGSIGQGMRKIGENFGVEPDESQK